MLRLVISTSAAARLAAAADFLAGRSPAAEVLILGASRGAADDLARLVAQRTGATFGLVRFSLTELAARMALAASGGRPRAPGTAAGAEATAARAVFDALAEGELKYFEPVARMPGFPRAVARTLHEVRLAGVSPDDVDRGHGRADAPAADVAALLARTEEQLTRAGVNDRAALFQLAARACSAARGRWLGLPLVVLDVPLDSRVEREFAVALAQRAPEGLITLPDGDDSVRDALAAALPLTIEVREDAAAPDSDLAHLRRFIFTKAEPPLRARAGDVTLYSAPGEGREAVEIVRRVLDEAAGGVRFDEMAVFLRAPQQYVGLLEHACARAGVPVYFDRGTRRPDPAGRAFIALLSCAAEGLSARRFDEYLSLGQVPQIAAAAGPVPPRGDEFPELRTDGDGGGLDRDDADFDPARRSRDEPVTDSDDEAVIAGTLRSPWKWEELIVESAVVGGRARADGKARWRRRLAGLAFDYQCRIAELQRDDPDSGRIAGLERDRRNLAHLRQFALPIVDALAEWPDESAWGEWLERFSALASSALRRPDRVLALLAELRPMSGIGPVTLDEARDVLHERLVNLDWPPPASRYGQLFVGTPHQARGRSFRVVFVPGLAERVVPQRPREDPLLLDERRSALDPALLRQEQRGAAERLLLKIAIGAASDRLYLSFPRLDVAESRARVPSFYALDVVRAMTGTVPDYRLLAAAAAEEAGATLAWPAPADADRAIDDLEHDLASLRPLLDSRDAKAVRGHAHYLLELNDALRRSVINRWARWRGPWADADGLVQTAPGIAAALDAHRLTRRPYSVSALQRFSACPYRFLLATILRLQPWKEPEPLVRMDPLTRGSLFHEVQARFYRTLAETGALPVRAAAVPDAVRTVERTLNEVAAAYAERLAPAIDRVWLDEIDDVRRDLGIWVQKLAEDPEWTPEYFELAFGLSLNGRDPRSLPDAIAIDGGFILHGSVDLVEQHTARGTLRITDHKTGKNRTRPGLVVDGGAVLQPVLYSAAIERGLGRRVEQGRLFYCTTAGGFTPHEITIDDRARAQGQQVLAVIDRAVGQGFLPAAPDDGACHWCDFRGVCGPHEEQRVLRKSRDQLADLLALRGLP